MLDIIIIMALLPVLPQVIWIALILLGLLTKRGKRRHIAKPLKFLIVIPAHNEEVSIGATLNSLTRLDYSEDLYDVLVIADNCSDKTASIARKSGAHVWERSSKKKSKGYALKEAFPKLMKETSADAFVVIDADTKVHSELLLEFAGDLSEGKDWIQGYYSGLNPYKTWRTKLMQWGFAVFNGSYMEGLQGLGVSVPLRGNGMCFSRKGLSRIPWSAHGLAEDMEFGWKLKLAGERVHFNRNAQVYGEFVSRSGSAAKSQRRRWEQGRAAVKQQVEWQLSALPLLKRFMAYLELNFKPLGFTVTYLSFLALAAGYFHSLGFSNQLTIGSIVFAMVGIVSAYVLSPFVFRFAKPKILVALIWVPYYLLWKALSLAGLKTSQEWQRTGRENETNSDTSHFSLGGVKFDRVTKHEAARRVLKLSGESKVQWVVTPNSDHLLRSQEDSFFKKITQEASLVVADGMPIVWASKLCGDPLPERVTGSDLLPLICKRAAKAGVKVCFFGGGEGEAKKAVKRVTRHLSGFQGVGIYPPFGFDKSETMTDGMIEQIKDSGAQIVFVGVGSPKQEKWIYDNRDKLPPAVYLGVGMSISLAAGTKSRAPKIFQVTGMEWLYRFMQEPRRLGQRYLGNLEIFRLIFQAVRNRNISS